MEFPLALTGLEEIAGVGLAAAIAALRLRTETGSFLRPLLRRLGSIERWPMQPTTLRPLPLQPSPVRSSRPRRRRHIRRGPL